MENITKKQISLILCILFGWFGVHRFYNGKHKSGILYLLTIGVFCIGWVYDIYAIATDRFSYQSSKPKAYSHSHATQRNSNTSYVPNTMNQARANTSNTNQSYLFKTKVVGVTFNNDDGSSRQQALSEMPDFSIVKLKPYDYQGTPAIAIVNEQNIIIGNVGKDQVSAVTGLIREYPNLIVKAGTYSGENGKNFGASLYFFEN